MLQRVVALAAESLKVLEHQLMDGGQIQDVKVGTKHLAPSELNHCALSNPPHPRPGLCRWSCVLPWTFTMSSFT